MEIMPQDDVQGRGTTDHAPRDLEQRQETKRLARQNRRAQRKVQRRAETAQVPVDIEATKRPSGPAAPASNPVGPLARRFGRIGTNMVIRQIFRMLLRTVMRR
jgi:hypothetical protein